MAARSRQPLSLVLADLDHFKEINDRYGHIAGDHALRHVAQRFQSVVRLEDVIARVGGEEFAILLTNRSVEEAAQVARLRYVLAAGVKEALVERPEEWPGVNSVRALTEGEALEGWWFDRTKECAARWRGEEHDLLKYATLHQVKLEPLRCWRMEKVPEEEVRRRVADLVEDIVAETAADRHARGVTVRGAKAGMAERPHKRPKKLKKSPAPQFHVATRKMLKELREAFAEFLREFLEASEKFRNGDLLSAGLPRPANQDEMFEDLIPCDLESGLYGAIEYVREDPLKLAIECLRDASKLTAEELEHRFRKLQKNEAGGSPVGAAPRRKPSDPAGGSHDDPRRGDDPMAPK
jgi:hypothetical protein